VVSEWLQRGQRKRLWDPIPIRNDVTCEMVAAKMRSGKIAHLGPLRKNSSKKWKNLEEKPRSTAGTQAMNLSSCLAIYPCCFNDEMIALVAEAREHVV